MADSSYFIMKYGFVLIFLVINFESDGDLGRLGSRARRNPAPYPING